MSLNRQLVFDTIARHLIAQGERAGRGILGNFTCLYLTKDGKKCAIGAIFRAFDYNAPCSPDRHPGYGAYMHAIHASWIRPEFGEPEPSDQTFLRQLQSVHDAYAVAEWRQCLRGVAGAYGLSPEVLSRAS